MPAITGSNLTKWRSHPYKVDGWLAIMPQNVVFKARVTDTTFKYPMAQIKWGSASIGNYYDTQLGQTIRISDSTGKVKGYLRVRKAATSTLLYVSHFSAGEINLATNDFIEVLNDYRPFVKVPRIKNKQNIFYKDYDLAFTSSYGAHPPPICVPGPDVAGFVNPSTGKLRVSFDLTSSYCNDHNALPDYYTCVRPGSTIVSGTISSGIFTLDINPGQYIYDFTIVDDNGNSHTAHRTVQAFDNVTYFPIQLKNVELSCGLNNGWSMSVPVIENNLDQTIIPDGSRVVFFVSENYGTAQASIGGTSLRTNVKFVGYVTEEKTIVNPYTDETTLSVHGPIGIMENMTAYPQTVKTKASPTKWYHVKDLDIWLFMWYHMYWQSNLLDLFDSEIPQNYLQSYAIPDRLDSTSGNLYEQISFAANSAGAIITADFQGKFFFRQNPQLQDSTYRSTFVATIVDLVATDWYDAVEIERQFRTPTMWLRGYAILASQIGSIGAVASIAPGKSPGQGSSEDTANEQIVRNQTELNVRTGNAYGLKKLETKAVRIKIANGGLVADPAYQEWVTLTLDGTSNKRGINYNVSKFLLVGQNVSFDFEAGVTEISWDLQPEVIAAPGTTVPVESGIVQIPPPGSKIVPPFSDCNLAYLVGTVFGNASSDVDACKILRSTNPAATTPTWESVVDITYTTLGLIDTGDTSDLHYIVIDNFKPDPWNPRNAAYILVRIANVSSNLRYFDVYYLENLTGPSTSVAITRLYRFGTGGTSFGGSLPNYVFIEPDPAVKGAISILATGINNGASYRFAYRPDYTSAFTTGSYTITDGYVNFPGYYGGLGFGSHSGAASNRTYLCTNRYLKYSASLGEPATTLIDLGHADTTDVLARGWMGLRVLRDGNTNDHALIALRGKTNNVQAVTYVDESDVITYIAPFSASLGQYRQAGWGLQGASYDVVFDVYPQNRNYMIMGADSGGNAVRIYRTTNGGATWSEDSTDFGIRYVKYWPYDPNVIFSCSNRGDGAINHPYKTLNGGTSWSKMTGNATTLAPDCKYFIPVPIWVK